MKSDQFQYLKAHPGVVVGAFPEAGLRGVLVGGAVGADAPEPFAVVPVHDVVADVGPGGEGAVRSLEVAVVFPEPEVADDGLGEDPPLAGEVQAAVRGGTPSTVLEISVTNSLSFPGSRSALNPTQG